MLKVCRQNLNFFVSHVLSTCHRQVDNIYQKCAAKEYLIITVEKLLVATAIQGVADPP